MQYLVMWLEGPLQSWGDHSKYGRRDTLTFPTKSAIYGMILAAMGAKGDQAEFLAKLSSLSQQIEAYSTPNPIMDFHMVGSGYNEHDGWERLCIPKKQDGSAAVGGGAKMTYRYYLQDAKFAVIQEITDDLVPVIPNALCTPVYSPSLGRKSCVPSEFIYQGIFRTQEEAKKRIETIAVSKSLQPIFSVSEQAIKNSDKVILHDVPLRFGHFKKYKERVVFIKTYERET
ncbi:type I-E CRISPR-associated protein Cas5/CasD [uncultured Sphaerochaeta sp.]|uniref:type I-E CRISPR-associated protein Cas5/CasD n=1 Tax=uncultured Sphaerochaeta sp. TaxID=886478 RepID=UPI0029CAA8BD|nr:type I-E CRISPR-associated protein Cas5/CasD [uncultured Sphaerochaeta sp.]